MIRVKIDAQKILKEHLFKGAKGTYLDLTLMDNKEGRDTYGNDGFVVQDIGKEARERGEKGPILENWKRLDKSAPRPSSAFQSKPSDDDDAPF